MMEKLLWGCLVIWVVLDVTTQQNCLSMAVVVVEERQCETLAGTGYENCRDRW